MTKEISRNIMPVKTVTTSAICDHTCWPQQFPQMLFKWFFWVSCLIQIFICVCGSSYLHCEWATEQQLVKDKRIQQKIKRFKMKQAQRALFFADVRTCDCLCLGTYCALPLCGHTLFVCLRTFLLVGVCLQSLVCFLGHECMLNTACLISEDRHICAHIFESLYSLIRYSMMFISVSRWWVGTSVYSLYLISPFSFLFVFSFCLAQMEEEPFNPDYVEVDRVLEVSYCEDKDTGEVKWILFHFITCANCVLSKFLNIFFRVFCSFEKILHSSNVFVSQKCPRPS